jgi:hypothetical protein
MAEPATLRSRAMTRLYVGALLVEALVLVALWLLSRAFV